jgi:xanthine dehydrogenase YagS FAD-binding subunit
MAVALLALDAKVTIFSGKESRTIDLKDFFILPEIDSENENILKPGEIVTEFIIPEIKPNTKSGYIKFKEREVWDFSVVSVGAVVQVNGKNIRSGRITFGGVAPIPWMEESTNKMLKGLEINDESLKKLTEEILRTAKPLSMNTYKLRLVRNLAKRLILALTS